MGIWVGFWVQRYLSNGSFSTDFPYKWMGLAKIRIKQIKMGLFLTKFLTKMSRGQVLVIKTWYLSENRGHTAVHPQVMYLRGARKNSFIELDILCSLCLRSPLANI